MQGVQRFERKCLLSLAGYYRLKAALSVTLEADNYSRLQSGGRYLVRSIYYDTRDLRSYYEKEDGNFGRIKLRLRAYTDVPAARDPVSVELKTKSGNVMTKYSTHVSYSDYLHFERSGHWPDTSDPVVMEFERLRHVRALEPVVLVQYRREGYRSRDRLPLRVTLDHGVLSARARSLFPAGTILTPHRPRHVILEIKTAAREPRWLTDLVLQHALKPVSNSKYVQGIEVIRPSMVTPRVAAP
ncbi:MAG: polyphosphate polymerase domain-containing protein [Spirochaetaceae bacterium]|nr:MAG: polyphosphate polymerase domain-containing protein [Spirochaetaceae bacterium]